MCIASLEVPLLWSDFEKLEFSGQIFEKCSDVNFHENTSSGSRVLW